jgi:hypothetical protein
MVLEAKDKWGLELNTFSHLLVYVPLPDLKPKHRKGSNHRTGAQDSMWEENSECVLT